MATVYKRKEKATGKPKRGAKWIMRFKDERGRWRSLSSGATCKQTAQAEANRRESVALKVKTGVSVASDQESVFVKLLSPLHEHVSAYRMKMENAGLSEKHIGDEVSIMNAFMENQKVQTVSDADSARIEQYINSLVKKNRSNRTVQKHITAMRTFFKYLVETEVIASNPTKGIKKPSPAKDRRHERRMVTREEWSWLASVTSQSKFRWNTTGASRRLLYWTAIETGYRSGEIRQLRKSDLRTMNDRSFICIEGKFTKNGKPAKQYLSTDLAAELFKHVRKQKPNASIFSMPASANVARMLKDDLKSARSSWIDEEGIDEEQRELRDKSDFLNYESDSGQKLDFHSLRHTCGAWLIIAGVDVKTVQTVMRHSTPTLTLNTYGHLLDGAEADAVAALKVGTQQIRSKLAAIEGNVPATGCGEAEETAEDTNEKKPQKTEVFATRCTDIPVSALAPPAGLEPATNGLTVHCSTN